MTATEGISIEKDDKGRVRRITVDAAIRPDLVEDILDGLRAEKASHDERYEWEEVRRELDAKHGIQR
ncbi:MAG: hypothetical protein H7Y12_13725 [Sphingobacteriaceae bacterium]|nr:hypothetical protein [Cytophagaceae bacterium]